MSDQVKTMGDVWLKIDANGVPADDTGYVQSLVAHIKKLETRIETLEREIEDRKSNKASVSSRTRRDERVSFTYLLAEKASMPIDALGLSSSTVHVLKRPGIKTLGDLCQFISDKGLRGLIALDNFGAKRLLELRIALSKEGVINGLNGAKFAVGDRITRADSDYWQDVIVVSVNPFEWTEWTYDIKVNGTIWKDHSCNGFTKVSTL